MSVPLSITFIAQPKSPSETLVVGCYEKQSLTEEAKKIDQETQGLITQALKKSRFKGELGQALGLSYGAGIDGKGTGAHLGRLVVIGLGPQGKLDLAGAQSLGGHMFSALLSTKDVSVDIDLSSVKADGLSAGEMLANIALGAQLRAWRFDKYKVKKKTPPDEDLTLQNLIFLTSAASAAKEAQKAYEDCEAIGEGVSLTRELVTEPANILYPETMAERLKNLTKLGVKVQIFDKKHLEKMGMGSLLCVAQGSARDARVVVLEWQGGKTREAPVAFVGKGVTFDTGGISLKPSGNMWDMKYDMAGAAAVGGVIATLAHRKAKVNAVGVMGLVENMPSGTATRPGDVVTSLSGQTIEVLNTDAEGRLVLADVLWYTQDQFKPKIMINLATLTGAILVALGSEYAGLFSNDDRLSQQLTEAGKKVEEKLWRLPLGKAFDKMMDSDIADIKNISTGGDARKAGSITAAQFLQRFVNDVPWAHLDIAGMAWAERPLPVCDRGATGFGVRLLDRLVRDYYEA